MFIMHAQDALLLVYLLALKNLLLLHAALPLQLEQSMDSAGAPGITLTLNPLCRCGAGYTVQVSFGVREEDSNDDCTPEQNKTAGIVPGGSVTLRVNSSTLIPAAGQEYCFIVHELDTLIEGGKCVCV